MSSRSAAVGTALVAAAAILGCGSSSDSGASGAGGTSTSSGGTSGASSSGASGGTSGTSGTSGASGTSGTSGTSGSSGTSGTPPPPPQDGPPAGNPTGTATVPPEGQPEDVSHPTTVIGTGTAASCTGDLVVAAVAKGGVITFDCGPDPVTIVLTATAKVRNDTAPKLVLDGGNKVTLSGGGKIRILYMSTCDKAQVYPAGPGDCNTNPGVQLVLQNITFSDGNAKSIADTNNAGGGGAVYAQGGSLKVVHSRFFNNVCADLGSDVGGGAIRKLDYLVAPGAGPARPVWIVNSTFGGKTGYGNSCANGGALSSIGVSWNILNSLLSFDTAVGHGANSGNGGNGGAIYNDGNEIVMNLTGSVIEDSVANEGGSAIFFVSNDKSGSITIKDSLTQRNPRGTFETPNLFGFYVIAKQPATVVNSQILR
jgi:hypothetical protein